MRTLLYESSDNLREIRKYLTDNTDFDCVFHIGASPYADLHVHDLDQPKYGFSSYRGHAKAIHSDIQAAFPTFVDMYCRNYSPTRQNLYRNWTYHQYLNTFNILVEEMSRVLLENDIEAVIFQRIPHLGSDYLLYVVAHALRLKVVLVQQCPEILGDRFFIFSSIGDFGLFSSSVKIEEEVVLPEINWNFEHKWGYMNQIEDFSDRLKSLQRNRFSPHSLAKDLYRNFDSNFVDSGRRGYEKLMNKREIAYLRVINEICDTNPEIEGPFVYFPLHLQPEMTTSALGGDFVDQVLAVERLHDILPKGWKILVKENPKQTAFMRDEAFFARLRRIESVVFVHPRFSTSLLLQRSCLVATVTGTAGWEALLGGKPVLVFGKPWYRSLDGVFEYSSSLDLKELSGSNLDRQAVEAGLIRLSKKTGAGRVYGSAKNRDLLLSKENTILVAQSLQKYLNASSLINRHTPCS